MKYTEAIERDRFNSVAFLLWGMLFIKRKRYDRALGKFNKAFITATYNENPDPANLSILEQWDDQEDSVLKDIDEEMISIDLSEESFSSSSALDSLVCDISHKEVNVAAVAYLNLALVSALLDYPKTALTIYHNVISNFGKTKYKNAACADLYNLYMNLGEYYKAAEMLAKILPSQGRSLSNEETAVHHDVEEDRGFAHAAGLKGNDLLRKGDYNSAADWFYKAYEKNKKGFLPNHNMAKIKAIEGNIKEAAEFLEAAWKIHSYAFERRYHFKSVDLECQLKTL